MKIAYYTLHYGSDYLGYSIKSIYDYVDKIFILYSDKPTFGWATELVNPDNKKKLMESAYLFSDPQNKIVWLDGYWQNEWQHREQIKSIAQSIGSEYVLTVDSDEIWDEECFKEVNDISSKTNFSTYKIRMLTLWKSFNWQCLDDMQPTRLWFPKRNGGEFVGFNSRVYHFGYARSIEDVKYKVSIHGHKSEWRNEWIEKYEKWSPVNNLSDLHPVAYNVWNATPYDKNILPSYMKSHPYYNLELIN